MRNDFSLRREAQRHAALGRALEFSGLPDSFVGTMSSLQRFAEGSEKVLPTNVEDVVKTMAVVEAAYESSAKGGVKPVFD